MSVTEIAVPDIGDFSEVEVIEVLVKAGDEIAVEQSLITVESDKASMEIPSPVAGKLQELKVKVGDKISKGSPIGSIASAEAAAPAPEQAKAAAQPPTASSAAASADKPAAAPSAQAPAEAAAPSPAAGPSPAPAASGGSIEVQVPDIGDFDQVEVIEVLVSQGDTVALEQSLITVESDKASMEIPSSAAGKVSKVLVKVGDKVAKGTPLVTIEQAASQPSGAPQAPAAPAPAAAATPTAAPAGAPPPVTPSAEEVGQGEPTVPATPSGPGVSARAHPVPAEMRDGKVAMKPHASPSVRLFARELGVDLTLVKGTGPKERITADDVRAFVKGVIRQAATTSAGSAAPSGGDAGAGLGLIPWPKVDFAKFGEVEVKPLSRIKKIAGANLHRNWVMIPHVTNHEDADITGLEAFRLTLNAENAKSGGKLTMLAFLVKACIAALKKFPEFNSSLDGDALVFKKYYHIGFAADTPNGLMVPVIRDADKKGLFEIAAETAELARKAREGKLAPGDMQGGTFSISSLGGIGGTYFTPIINAPEVAILGVCRSVRRPVWNENKNAFEPRLILPLSLSWDHRVIDGAAAARFNTYLAQLLADFRRVML
jgi:pyruvate dehydrogenase E2 component (dihydrolipoamide acetyltransferase)